MIRKEKNTMDDCLTVGSKTYLFSELTFDDIAFRGGTGRAYYISGEGRDKVYGYRIGCSTPIGDIEECDWIRAMKYLINTNGQQMLFKNLLEWYTTYNYANQSKKELEKETLISFSYKLFDDQQWCDFLKFNQKYRPEILKNVELVQVKVHCCNVPGFVTKYSHEHSSHWGGHMCCPHCGRYATYDLV